MSIPCGHCGIIGPYFIVELTDDYLTLRCPGCHFEFAITVGQDLEK